MENNCQHLHRNERWLPIPGFSGYEVSDMGRLRSIKATGRNNKIRTAPIILKPQIMKKRKGYLFHALYKDGKYHNLTVAAAVLLAFVGPKLEGMEACHGNRDKTDNRLTNLRWDTHINNELDKVAHGTSNRVRSVDDVKSILTRVSGGERQKDVAADLGIGTDTVSRIVNRKIWGWVRHEERTMGQQLTMACS